MMVHLRFDQTGIATDLRREGDFVKLRRIKQIRLRLKPVKQLAENLGFFLAKVF